MKNTIICLSILTIICGCSKNEDSYDVGNSSSSTNVASTNSCSTISAQNSVTSNGVSYIINALAGSANSIGVEVINNNGPFTSNYSMQLLEVSNGNVCATNSSSTESLPGIGKFFEFQNLPAFSSNASTVAKVKIMLDGNIFAIQDLNVNQ
tara:strand:+ start:164 stop:616 length:453 start_codon:yes stop_codon:yes gene_type:complete